VPTAPYEYLFCLPSRIGSRHLLVRRFRGYCRGLVPWVPWAAGYGPKVWIRQAPSSSKQLWNYAPHTRYAPHPHSCLKRRDHQPKKEGTPLWSKPYWAFPPNIKWTWSCHLVAPYRPRPMTQGHLVLGECRSHRVSRGLRRSRLGAKGCNQEPTRPWQEGSRCHTPVLRRQNWSHYTCAQDVQITRILTIWWTDTISR
jgi:hypothetical protein